MGFAWIDRALAVGLGIGVGGCVLGEGSFESLDSGVVTASSSLDGGECPLGASGCACTVSGVCDPGLTCDEGTCVEETCHLGGEGCRCTPGGGCDVGLTCQGGMCREPRGTTTGSSTSTSTSTSTSGAESVDEGSSTSTTTTGVDGSTSTSSDDGPDPLDAWTRRRPLLLLNGAAQEIVDAQLLVSLAADDDMNADYSDLRFSIDGQTMLPHWIESGSESLVTVWVRVPNIPARGFVELYAYYGNSTAADVSDGEATFDGFEDFFGIALDPVEWTTTGVVAVTGGQVYVQTGSAYSNEPVAVAANRIVEARLRWPAVPETGPLPSGVTVAIDPNPVAAAFMSIARTGTSLVGRVSDGSTLLLDQVVATAPAVDVPVWLGLVATDATVRLEVNRTSVAQAALPSLTGGYLLLGDAAGAGAGTSNVDDVAVDIVLVRKEVPVLPDVFVGAEQTL